MPLGASVLAPLGSTSGWVIIMSNVAHLAHFTRLGRPWLVASTLGVCLLAASACGQSEVYYSVDGQRISGPAPGPGKGDNPVPQDLPLSPEVLSLPEDDSPLELGPSQLQASFSQQGVSLRPRRPMVGLSISWDGANSTLYARARTTTSNGTWVEVPLVAEQSGSFRAQFDTAVPADTVDLFIVRPAGITFMLIEPIY